MKRKMPSYRTRSGIQLYDVHPQGGLLLLDPGVRRDDDAGEVSMYRADFRLSRCYRYLLMSVLLFTLVGQADADISAMDQGKLVFTYHCAPCHGAGPGLDGSKMLPVTAAIANKYQGAVPPLLEERDNLTPEYLEYIVRHGSGPMPTFRKTEISDAEMDALSAYLMRKNKRATSY